MNMPANAKLFIPTVDTEHTIPEDFVKARMLVSAVTNENPNLEKIIYANKYIGHHDSSVIVPEVCNTASPEQVIPSDSFHYSFSFPGACGYIKDNGEPIVVKDTLRQWECSSLSQDRTAPMHLILVEQMLKSIIPGGYMGIVLPRRWVGSNMQFIGWLGEHCSKVAQVKLADHAVYTDSGKDEDGNPIPIYHKGWVLLIFQKRVKEDTNKKNTLFFATQVYSTFVTRLSGWTDSDLENVCKKFRRHDWCRYSVRQYSKMLIEGGYGKYSLNDSMPPRIDSPGSGRVISFINEDKLLRPMLYDNLQDIKKNPLSAHIKIGPPVKISVYNPVSISILTELRSSAGYDKQEIERVTNSISDGNYRMPRDRFTMTLASESINKQFDGLLSCLVSAGLSPCMIRSDYNRMSQQAKWLNLQLSPIERCVRVPSEDEEADDTWELMNDDISIKASYPEIFSLWTSRAKKMKLDNKRCTYDFQFEDVILSSCKQSVLNGNVMGLGKTREALFWFLLRGGSKCLIVVPTRLIGIWQDEIEKTISSYARIVKRNWMGKQIKSDYQIIKYAQDCLPHKLCTFNIISYEDMSSVPKDAMFFKCPECGFVVCSPFSRYKEESKEQQCPRCNYGMHKKDKIKNKMQGRKKYLSSGKVILSPNGGKARGNGNRYTDSGKDGNRYTDSGKDGNPIVIDNRINTPRVMMEPQENQFVKVKRREVLEKVLNKETNQIEIKTVLYNESKGLHLKWTFAELLRNLFNFRISEESNYIKNPTTQRSLAMFHCRSRSRMAMTGTPIRGYARSIVSILNWVFKRSVFPYYRNDGSSSNGIRKFEKKYATYVQREGKQPKQIPKINQPELFQQEIAPLMIRRLRHEPLVAKDIPPITPNERKHLIVMDDEHREYYEKWLKKFAEWWMLKRKEVDHKESAKVVNDLIVKLGYLINISSIPHFAMDNLGSDDGKMWAAMIGKYRNPEPVAKFKVATQMIIRNALKGEKTIVFNWRKANVKLGHAWCRQNKDPVIHSVWVDGSIANAINPLSNRSPKQERIDKFCYTDAHVLWATTATLKEGFNIPQANNGIFLEYTWEPADYEQGIGRMLRPSQKKIVNVDFLCHKGTVDEYVAALVFLKARSASEGVDFESFDDFNASMIPDFVQYANAIVDGKEDILRTKMWTQVEELKKKLEEEDG